MKIKIKNISKSSLVLNYADSTLKALHLIPKEESSLFDGDLVSSEMLKKEQLKMIKIISVED